MLLLASFVIYVAVYFFYISTTLVCFSISQLNNVLHVSLYILLWMFTISYSPFPAGLLYDSMLFSRLCITFWLQSAHLHIVSRSGQGCHPVALVQPPLGAVAHKVATDCRSPYTQLMVNVWRKWDTVDWWKALSSEGLHFEESQSELSVWTQHVQLAVASASSVLTHIGQELIVTWPIIRSLEDLQ